MRIVIKSADRLTQKEFDSLYEANFGPYGMMQEEIYRAWQDDDPDTWAIMYKHGHELYGWALLTPVTTDMSRSVSATSYTKRKSKYTVQFYVYDEHRRKGIAKRLMEEVLEIDPRPHVMPHDIKSGEFFAHYDVTVTNWDKPWQRPKKPLAS